LKKIATVYSDFPDKFGIPRQGILAPDLEARIVMEPEYRSEDALRGIDGYDRLWIIWEFSEAIRENVSLTVRPPRLGGNTRMGVFATRSPFRPNPVGLTCVQLERVEWNTPLGPQLVIRGADMMSGTPVYDIKPYLAYADSFPDAKSGFADILYNKRLSVEIPDNLSGKIPEGKLQGLSEALALDPRPGYQNDPERIYGITYAGFNIQFKVCGDHLTVTGITPSGRDR
jgi:tRNA-Thr(GGU) m(6)t(6)A37 methyltransferase TsaA